MSLYKNLIDFLTQSSFEELNEIYSENECCFGDFDIYYNSKAMLVIKSFDNWLSLKETWHLDQINILKLIKKHPKFSTKTYFILCLEDFDVHEDEKLDVHIIERDERICKKYVLTRGDDISRMPMLNEINFSLEFNDSYEDKFREKLLENLQECNDKVADEIRMKIENYFIEQKDSGEIYED